VQRTPRYYSYFPSLLAVSTGTYRAIDAILLDDMALALLRSALDDMVLVSLRGALVASARRPIFCVNE